MALDKERVVVVTGASRGAGKGIALALGERGDTVYVTGRSRNEGDADLPGTVQATADAITEAGAGGHFFGVAHTMTRYETAFYHPFLTDQRNFENWQEGGSIDAQQRANTIWKQLLADYEQPPLDPAIDDELTDYVERRKRGAEPD